MDQDLVLRARIKLMSENNRILRGPEALPVYRLLAGVSPAVYGAKLAHVLIRESRSQGDQELRRALLEEALAVAEALDAAHPYREREIAWARAELSATHVQ
ncbi:hypothetical protein ABT095_31315 [Kitasatospora sp. NPDC002227]|uniref:hypothetical protein n=1 Tax=Kitasatospora sp. NPDC002227 TaxID=3154773 RepID=UPI00331E72E5